MSPPGTRGMRLTCNIWSNLCEASLLTPDEGTGSALSPAIVSDSLYVPVSDMFLVFVALPSSLGLFERFGLVRGEDAGDADCGGGRGCWCILEVLDGLE